MPIEKEIKHESKVAFGLTARQLLSVAAGLVICVALYFITGLPFSALMFPFTVVAVICGLFGWFQKDGLRFEHVVAKFFKKMVYKSEKLKYRTSNLYVKVYNLSYLKDMNAESKNKKKEKTAKREKSSLTAYM